MSFARRPADLQGHTVVIDLRGGTDGASMPLKPPHGYAYALQHLSPAILSRAAILYIWVIEESRRKNIARADPNDPGSILHHSCPESVMRKRLRNLRFGLPARTEQCARNGWNYCEGQTFNVPTSRFDNRTDLTTFVREENPWPSEAVVALESGLSGALAKLWRLTNELPFAHCQKWLGPIERPPGGESS